jgi:hypothetical protein
VLGQRALMGMMKVTICFLCNLKRAIKVGEKTTQRRDGAVHYSGISKEQVAVIAT